MNKNPVASKADLLTKVEKFGPIPVGVEVVEGVLPMTCTLSLRAPCRVILFCPCALDALPTSHT